MDVLDLSLLTVSPSSEEFKFIRVELSGFFWLFLRLGYIEDSMNTMKQ